MKYRFAYVLGIFSFPFLNYVYLICSEHSEGNTITPFIPVVVWGLMIFYLGEYIYKRMR